MHKPIISVLLPVYNEEKYIKKSIESILAQTFVDFEIIVIDDGTLEKTMEVVQSLNEDRILYKKTKENLGCADARKLGVEYSNGEFITFLDDDDIWENDYLTNQLQVFNENPSLDFVVCDYQVQGDIIDKRRHNMKPFTINFKSMIHQRPGPFFQCCMFNNKILKASEISKKLRLHKNPVIGYIKSNKFHIDLKAIPQEQIESLAISIKNTLE